MLTYGGSNVEGSYTSQSKFSFFPKQIFTIVMLDEARSKALAARVCSLLGGTICFLGSGTSDYRKQQKT